MTNNDMPSATQPGFSSEGILLGCISQIALFFAGYALLLWLVPDLLSITAPLSATLVMAALLLVSWLLPVVVASRRLSRSAEAAPERPVDRYAVWVFVSAILASAVFVASGLRV